MSFLVGVDVGGTNTDSVLIDLSLNHKIVSKSKSLTTKDVVSGIKKSI